MKKLPLALLLSLLFTLPAFSQARYAGDYLGVGLPSASCNERVIFAMTVYTDGSFVGTIVDYDGNTVTYASGTISSRGTLRGSTTTGYKISGTTTRSGSAYGTAKLKGYCSYSFKAYRRYRSQ